MQDAHEALFSTLMCALSDEQQFHLELQQEVQLRARVQSMLAHYASAAQDGSQIERYLEEDSGTDVTSDAASVASMASIRWRPGGLKARKTNSLRRPVRSAQALAPPTLPTSPPLSPRGFLTPTPPVSAAAHDRVAEATNPFTGWLLRSVVPTGCLPSCTAVRVASPEPFQCLSVALPQIPGALTLSGCLAAYFRSDRVQGWKCECGGLGCIRRVRLARPPPVLAVHLQRAPLLGGAPDARHVSFPEVLDMQPAWLPRGARRRQYVLCSVVQHVGASGAGHYFAFRRRPQQPTDLGNSAGQSCAGWLLMNDAVVREATEQQVLACTAYMLFYIRSDCMVPACDQGRGVSGAKLSVVSVPSRQAWKEVGSTLASMAAGAAEESTTKPVTPMATEERLRTLLGLQRSTPASTAAEGAEGFAKDFAVVACGDWAAAPPLHAPPAAAQA